MRKLTIAVALIIIIALVICLSATIPTKIRGKVSRQFGLLKSTLIVNEIYRIGDIELKLFPIFPSKTQDITVFAIITYEPNRKKQATRGLLLDYSGYYQTQFYLDLDEAKALSQALDEMMKFHRELSKRKSLPDALDIKFITHAGLGIGLFRYKELFAFAGFFDVKKSGDDYKIYPEFQPSQLASQNVITVKLEDISRFKELIDRGYKFLTSH